MDYKTTELQAKIKKMPKATQEKVMSLYEEQKLNMGSARACRFFGFHYIHTGKIGLRFLYLISCFIYGLGIIRWIIQGAMLKQEINNKNYEILEKLYLLYK